MRAPLMDRFRGRLQKQEERGLVSKGNSSSVQVSAGGGGEGRDISGEVDFTPVARVAKRLRRREETMERAGRAINLGTMDLSVESGVAAQEVVCAGPYANEVRNVDNLTNVGFELEKGAVMEGVELNIVEDGAYGELGDGPLDGRLGFHRGLKLWLRMLLEDLFLRIRDTWVIEEIRKVERELEGLFEKDEIFWRQRSRTDWLVAGDCNTKFFHGMKVTKLFEEGRQVWDPRKVRDLFLHLDREAILSIPSSLRGGVDY
ncbi:hypothetical protein ACOSQ2_007699 [Xanthoceras sorbifolium]